MIFLPIKTYVNDRLSSLPKMKKKRLKNAAAPEEKKCSTRPSFLLRKVWFWPIFAPAVKHLEMAAIWRWCALGSIWCVSPGYCHRSAKGCHHGHPTSQSISRSSTFSRTETKFKFISLPLRKVAQEKMVWAGRATAIPPNFTFFSGRLARHRSILLRMNWNFWYPWPWKQTQNFEIYCQLFLFEICTRPLNRASFTDRPVSFGPLFPPPSLCGSPLHSWTCFKGR